MKDAQLQYFYKCVKPCVVLMVFFIAVLMQPAVAGTNVSDYKAVVTATSGLNVRSGPGINYPRISTLRYGSAVTVTHHYGSWSKIDLGPSKSAYVSNRYLRADNNTGTSSIPVNRPQTNELNVTNYRAIVTASALNVRSGPGTSHGIIGKRYRNSSVLVTHHNGIWRKLAWSRGASAYVHGNYLRKQPTPAQSSTSGAGFDTGPDPEGLLGQSTSQIVDVTSIQELENKNPGAAEEYVDCMFGKLTSKGGAILKAWTLFKNGVRHGLKKIATSPMIGVNHVYCAAKTHDWAAPEPAYSRESQTCTPTMGGVTGCKELDGFYGTDEGRKIWDAFLFTDTCDAECRLSCYFHGKNKRTLDAFMSDPATVDPLMCRYQ